MTFAEIFLGEENVYLKITLAAPVIYFAIIAFVRVAGKRSTSQMNNFDWIVTVAIGSIIASGILMKDVAIFQSLYAIGLLFALQWLVTWGLIRSKLLKKTVKATPTLLVSNGELLRDAMRQERIGEAEIHSALREAGLIDLSEVQWIILESDAQFSVIAKKDRDLSQHHLYGVSNSNL